MSFLQKAKEAASQAADQARQVTDQVADKVTDRDTHAKVKGQVSGGFGVAKRGMKTAVERIDPGTLAELIIKATALQETANRALRDKGSLYRISEVTIAATIPPGVNFTIARTGDHAEAPGADAARSSTELLAASTDEGEILSLAGEAETAALLEAVAAAETAPPDADG